MGEGDVVEQGKSIQAAASAPARERWCSAAHGPASAVLSARPLAWTDVLQCLTPKGSVRAAGDGRREDRPSLRCSRRNLFGASPHFPPLALQAPLPLLFPLRTTVRPMRI